MWRGEVHTAEYQTKKENREIDRVVAWSHISLQRVILLDIFVKIDGAKGKMRRCVTRGVTGM